jgi:protein-disulfide isomerase
MTRTSLFIAAAALALATGACKDKGAGNAASGGGSSDAPVAVTPPADGDWTKSVRATSEGGFQMGNPNAKVKLVEFGSLTCSHCADFSQRDEPALREKYIKTGKVAFEFRNYVRDPLDITASLIARCNGPATFFPLTEQMFADQKGMFERFQATPAAEQQALQSLPPAQQFQKFAEYSGLTSFAAQRGVPSAKQKACLSNQAEIDRLVQMNSDATSQYQLPGTPAFLINGVLFEAPAGQPLGQALSGAIDKALAG